MKINHANFFVFSILVSVNAQAIDLGYGFTLKGFGTGGLVNSSNDNADFVANSVLQPNGAGTSGNPSLVVDTKIGLQLDYKVNDRLSFAAQGLSKQQYNKSFVPVLEWAYAKFKLMPELDIRVGRIRPAIYMLSDYLDVNYVNPWVRPPTEFYSSAPISHMEGVDFLWRPTTGDISWLVQPYYGVTELGLLTPQGVAGQLNADHILGINLSASYSDFTLRFGYAQTELTIHSDKFSQATALLNGICNYGDQTACYQASAASPLGKHADFLSVGANWDNGDYFVLGEYGKRTTKTYAVADVTSWYLSSGARFKKITPYITYSAFHNDSPVAYGGDTTPGLGNIVNQITTAVMQGNSMDQNTLSLGVRYDFMPNLALKGQWDHVQTSTKSGIPGSGSGLFAIPQPDFANGGNQVDLFSVTLDFVF